MKLHNITLYEEENTGWMLVPHGKFYVRVGMKEEVLGESRAELGRRVLESVIIAFYHSIKNSRHLTVH